jgi:peptide/nickel transport system permease protein
VSVRGSRFIGAVMLGGIALLSIGADSVAPHDPARQFPDAAYAPPMIPHLRDGGGHWRRPFVYPLRLADRLERRFEEDHSRPVPLRWFVDGTIVSVGEQAGPWLLLGGDSYGRDIFARVVRGARASLGVSLAAALGALAFGALVGALAGYWGGRVDEILMRIADFVLVLPAIYVVLALRAAMPLVLSPPQIFGTMVVVLAAAGWPYPARGVRAIVAAERRKEYAESARAQGAGSTRILLRHLLPATKGFLGVQATLLVPAFILAETTLSFVGLGFSEPTPSWGLMLYDASRGGAMADAPWLLTPAVAIVCAVLGLHLMAGPWTPVDVPSRPTN